MISPEKLKSLHSTDGSALEQQFGAQHDSLISLAGPHETGPPRQQHLKLRSLRFSTADLSSSERFSAWRDFHSRVLSIEPAKPDAVEQFDASVEYYDFDGLLVSHVARCECLVSRTASNIAAASLDYLVVKFPLTGMIHGIADERPYFSGSKAATLLDFTRPYFNSHAQDAVTVQIPRESVEEMIPGDMANIHGAVIESSHCELLRSLLIAALQSAGTLTQGDAMSLRQSMNIFIRRIVHDAHRAAGGQTMPRHLVLQRKIRKYINDAAASETPSPEDLASRFNLSRRVLYSLFEPHGGVATYIRSAKLKKIHQRLSDPLEIKPIKTIAAEHGFHDEQQFSRIFKKHLKTTAGSVRLHASSRTSNTDVMAEPQQANPNPSLPSPYLDFIRGTSGA